MAKCSETASAWHALSYSSHCKSYFLYPSLLPVVQDGSPHASGQTEWLCEIIGKAAEMLCSLGCVRVHDLRYAM